MTSVPAFPRVLPCVLLAVLLGAASAQAVVPSGNLLANPGAEADVGSTDATCGGDLDVTGWAPETATFSAIQYGIGAFPSVAESAEIGGGSNLFTGGCPGTTPESTAEQTVALTEATPEIDAGQVMATLSGYLGGFENQDDQAKVEVFFLGESGGDLGSPGADLVIGPVTAADRANLTDLLLRTAQAGVPVGTRSVLTRITLTRFAGSSNDGYADNLSLTLGSANPPPVVGRTVNVETVRGVVFIRLRGGRFTRLDDVSQIPVGSLLDTRRGTVRLTSARDRSGATQSGNFSAGIFQVAQSRKRSAKGITELRLKGSSFASCGKRRARGGDAHGAGLSRRVIRRLRGNARGRFRTRGRNSAATLRSTIWEVIDRCDGTLTRVRRGRVAVRDFRRNKTVIVRAGKSYLAQAR